MTLEDTHRDARATPAGPRRWGFGIGPVLVFVALVVRCVWLREPPEGAEVVVWTFGFVATVTRTTTPREPLRAVVVGWLPYMLLMNLFTSTRSVATTFHFPVHFEPMIGLDKLIGLGTVPTERLQGWLTGAQPRLWEGLLVVVYLTHFFAILFVAARYWMRDRARFVMLRNAYGVLCVTALTTFIFFPAAPPWASTTHGIGNVTRLTARSLGGIGLASLAPALNVGQRGTNPYAAMPSMHAATAALIAVVALYGRAARTPRARLARAAVIAYPLVMAFALVYFGEHWVADILIGWGYTAVAYGAAVLIATAPRRSLTRQPAT